MSERHPKPAPCGAASADAQTFAAWLTPLRQGEWVVYAKRPFAGPEAVLAYLSRYTHRVAIANRRLVAHDERGITFKWKDYHAKGRTRHKTMSLDPAEFIRRFLLHVLPRGFHRIRHYGLLANATRCENLARARALLQEEPAGDRSEVPAQDDDAAEHAADETTAHSPFVCPDCGAPMIILETFLRGRQPRAPPASGGNA